MPDDLPDLNPWFRFIRSAKLLAVTCIQHGLDPAETRSFVHDLAVEGLPNREPLRSWTGSLLSRAVDETIYSTMHQIHEGP